MLTDHCTRRASERNPLAFAPLPHALRRDPRLTTRAVTIAAALLEHARDQPYCDPTNRQLAADDHCSTRTVQYALASLRAAGWIAVEQGPDGRVIHLVWRETPRHELQPPHATSRETPCNGQPDPMQRASAPPCNALREEERREGKERNVTCVPPPAEPQTAPEEPALPATAPRPSQPVRPLLDELKALPGADGSKVRSVAWRLAHHLKDVASVAFFTMVLSLVAKGSAPLQRLLDAFRVADRSRESVRKPGAIFNATWSGWQPAPKPSEINRPTYYRAPATTPRPEPPPEPEPPSRETISEEMLRDWETWASMPRHPLAGYARKVLAAYHAGELPREGP